jgi:hypothetical protein
MIWTNMFLGVEISSAPTAVPPIMRNSAHCMRRRGFPPSSIKPPITATVTTPKPIMTNTNNRSAPRLTFLPQGALSCSSVFPKGFFKLIPEALTRVAPCQGAEPFL